MSGWLIWFLARVEAAASRAEQAVANTFAKARFWLRHRSTLFNERQHKVLGRFSPQDPADSKAASTRASTRV